MSESKEPKIKLLKLVTGEYIMGEMKNPNNWDAGDINLKNVVTIQAVRQPGHAEPTIGFTMWMPFTEDESLKINSSHVVTVMNPLPEFVNQYRQLFSNIIMPQSPSSTGKLIIPNR